MHPANSTDDATSNASTHWHLVWQAAVGRELFAEGSLYLRVRERLLDAHRQRGRALIHYLLLPTEIHVISRIPSGDTAGGVARAIGNVVGRWVRELEPVRSPVFAGPFQCTPIDSTPGLRNEIRMLAWRPVLDGLCGTPSHYTQSALRIALGLSPARGFDARPLLHEFGDSVPQARAALRAWISRRPPDREVHEWALSRGLMLAVGRIGPNRRTARAVRGAAAALIAAGGPTGVEGALRLLEAWVAARLGLPGVLDLQPIGGVAGARGRALVACLAVEHQLCSAASVARHFRRAKATLSEQMTACRSRAIDRQIIAWPVQRVIDEALALLRAQD